jgi:hypothetical protein
MLKAPADMPMRRSASPISKLDQDGRYRFTGVIPGAEYQIWYSPGGLNAAEHFQVKDLLRVNESGTIDLGDFTVPAPPPAAKGKGEAARP